MSPTQGSTTNGRHLNPSGLMTRRGYRLALFSAWGLLVLSMICGCGGSGNRDLEEKVLIRAGESVVTVRDFHQTFESGITAPSLLFQDPDALRDEKYRILNRLTEELLILERARELNLQVSDEETEQVVSDFKKDFPDDTFEKTLMENGISFLTWRKALKRRLLMEKVIRQDLSEHAFGVPIAANEDGLLDDMRSPPENEVMNDDAQLSAEDETVNDDTQLPAEDETVNDDAQLPAEDEAVNPDNSEDETPPDDKAPFGIPPQAIAAEAEYPDWINHLKQQYAIEIDWKLWETIEQEQPDGL